MNVKTLLPHLRLIACAALMSAVLPACDVHEFPDGNIAPTVVESNVVLRYFDLDMPTYTTVEFDSDGRRTTRTSNTDISSRHIIKVYPDKGDSGSRGGPSRSEAAVTVITDAADAATIERDVTISLPPGRYTYLAWTDYSLKDSDTDLYYSTSDFDEINLLSEKRDGYLFHDGNTPWRDAFRGEGCFIVGNDGLMYTDGTDTPLAEAVIPMKRPLARFVFIATDLHDFISRHELRPSGYAPPDAEGSAFPIPSIDLTSYHVVFRYPGYMPSGFNNFINKPVNSITGAAFDGSIRASSAEPGTAELGSDYVFVNGRESAVQVAIDVYDRKTGNKIASTSPLTIPLIRNHLTIVRGKFLTSNTGSNIGVDPGFNGDINIEIK